MADSLDNCYELPVGSRCEPTHALVGYCRQMDLRRGHLKKKSDLCCKKEYIDDPNLWKNVRCPNHEHAKCPLCAGRDNMQCPRYYTDKMAVPWEVKVNPWEGMWGAGMFGASTNRGIPTDTATHTTFFDKKCDENGENCTVSCDNLPYDECNELYNESAASTSKKQWEGSDRFKQDLDKSGCPKCFSNRPNNECPKRVTVSSTARVVSDEPVSGKTPMNKYFW